MGQEKTLNKVILIGRLGANPRLQHLRQKRPLCTFDIATQGVRVTDTAWHTVVVYGKLAERCYQELKKGSLVYVEGPLEGRIWEDRGGRRHKSYAIYPKVVQALESARSGSWQPQERSFDQKRWEEGATQSAARANLPQRDYSTRGDIKDGESHQG